MKKVSEKQIEEMVYMSVKKALNESVFGDKFDGYKEGNPKKLKDVIIGDGWGFTVQKLVQNGDSKECTIYQNPHGHSLSPKELVEDVNVYLEDKGYNMRAFLKPDSEYYYKLIFKKY